MYVFARGLSSGGVDVTFIRDRKDNFPHSQPVWNDIECYFQSGFSYKNIDWDHFEIENKWIKPNWYYEPYSCIDNMGRIFKESKEPFFVRYLASKIVAKNNESFSVFEKMLQCDKLIVCGTEASILAMLSGRPYIIFPHGSDIRVAVGAKSLGAGLKSKIIGWLVMLSFRKAITIGSTLPDGSAAIPKQQYRRLKNIHIDRMPLPYDLKERLSVLERRNKLKKLMSELNVSLPQADFYAFTPSRVSFQLKGHDRLLGAIKELKGTTDNIHFIFIGWGDDYQEVEQYISENGICDRVTLLPIFCSKLFLYRLFESVDFVVDSFGGTGTYGTSLSEAWSTSCPTVTWISDLFQNKGWEEPPVIPARSEEDISTALGLISSGVIDLDEVSEKVNAWFGRVHSNSSCIKAVDACFKGTTDR